MSDEIKQLQENAFAQKKRFKELLEQASKIPESQVLISLRRLESKQVILSIERYLIRAWQEPAARKSAEVLLEELTDTLDDLETRLYQEEIAMNQKQRQLIEEQIRQKEERKRQLEEQKRLAFEEKQRLHQAEKRLAELEEEIRELEKPVAEEENIEEAIPPISEPVPISPPFIEIEIPEETPEALLFQEAKSTGEPVQKQPEEILPEAQPLPISELPEKIPPLPLPEIAPVDQKLPDEPVKIPPVPAVITKEVEPPQPIIINLPEPVQEESPSREVSPLEQPSLPSEQKEVTPQIVTPPKPPAPPPLPAIVKASTSPESLQPEPAKTPPPQEVIAAPVPEVKIILSETPDQVQEEIIIGAPEEVEIQKPTDQPPVTPIPEITEPQIIQEPGQQQLPAQEEQRIEGAPQPEQELPLEAKIIPAGEEIPEIEIVIPEIEELIPSENDLQPSKVEEDGIPTPPQVVSPHVDSGITLEPALPSPPPPPSLEKELPPVPAISTPPPQVTEPEKPSPPKPKPKRTPRPGGPKNEIEALNEELLDIFSSDSEKFYKPKDK